jgi:hypothetical protein
MAYERVENDDSGLDTEYISTVWDELADSSPQTQMLDQDLTAGELPQLEITDASSMEAAGNTVTSVESSIQDLVLAANEQLSKQLGDLATAEFKTLLEDLKHEKETGEFGTASRKAFRSLVETMQTRQLPQHLRALTEFGIPVPPGFPVEETNSSDGLQLFARRITAGERALDLKIDVEKPGEEDLRKLAKAFDWLIAADAGIQSYAKEREVKFLHERIKDLGLDGWSYKEGEDKESWARSAKSMVDLTDRVSNTIRAMHYLYKSSAEGDFPVSLPDGATIRLVLEICLSEPCFPADQSSNRKASPSESIR